MQKIVDVKYAMAETTFLQAQSLLYIGETMPIKNLSISIPYKIQVMKNSIYKLVIVLITALAVALVLNSCSKVQAVIKAKQQTALEKQFEDNILNQNFRVQLATDDGVDLTPQFTGYTFRLLKTTYYNGVMTAEKNSITYNGTWSCNEDYSKLTITLPPAPTEFLFLIRDWKFTKKSLPIMEFAPWGTLEPKVLHMERF